MPDEAPKGMLPSTQGPFLKQAVLCEKVLQEADGVLSVIRVVDRIIQQAVGVEVPPEMPPFPLNLTALLSFVPGAARGRHTVKLRPEAPSGQQLAAIEMPVILEGEDRGANLIVNLGFQADQEGLYWIDVLFDEQPFTRMPLRVLYQPQRLAGMQPGLG